MSDITNAPTRPRPLSKEQVRAWLDYQMEPLITRRDEAVVPALIAMAEAHPVIEDDEIAGQFAENIAMARQLVRDAEAAHKEHKRPYLDGGGEVDGWKNRFIAAVEKSTTLCTTIALAYAEKQEAAQRAERAAVAAKAKAEADKAMRQNAFSEHTEAALAAHRRAEAAAQVRPAELSRHHGVYGAVSSIRQTWVARVTDFAIVPRAFLCLDEKAVNMAKKQRDETGKPVAVIPGIEWVAERDLGVR